MIDEARFRALFAAHKNAIDSSPAFSLLQAAAGRATRARTDLERHRASGPTGQATRENPDIAVAYARTLSDLQRQVAETETEKQRVEQNAAKWSAERQRLSVLIDGCRAWAREQNPPVTLPGDDQSALALVSYDGSRVLAPPVPVDHPFAATPPPPAQAAPPPSSHVERGNSISRMMRAVWP